MRIRKRRPLAVRIAVYAVLLILSVGGAYIGWPRQSAQQLAHASTTTTTEPQPQQVAPAAAPARLKVPAIGIDAKIDPMGMTTAGDMESPAGARETGWYKLGPNPGNIGSAVVAGHYGRWQNGDGSVFDNLHILKAGDKIYVTDVNNTTISFTVRTTRLFGRNDDSRSVFTSNDGKAHLNLITCQGKWNANEETYADRLVVFADRD